MQQITKKPQRTFHVNLESHSDGSQGLPLLCFFQLWKELKNQGFKSNEFLQCCFSGWSLKRPQDNVRYLILSIPWHILEVIKMSSGLFLNTLLPEFGRWEHWLLLLKGKVKTRKRNSFQDSMHELAASRGPEYSSIHISRTFTLNLKTIM